MYSMLGFDFRLIPSVVFDKVSRDQVSLFMLCPSSNIQSSDRIHKGNEGLSPIERFSEENFWAIGINGKSKIKLLITTLCEKTYLSTELDTHELALRMITL
jgi:hypothetical protein